MWKTLVAGAALAFSVMLIAPQIQAVDLTTGLSDAAGQNGAGYNTSQGLEVVVGQIIKIVLGLLGVVFLIITVYAGITWMTAAGDEKKITSAKGMLTSAVIGLVIVLAAYSITFFVVDQLGRATSGPGVAPAAGS